MTRQDKKEEVGYRLVAAKPMRRRIIGYRRQLNFSEKQWPRAHLTTSNPIMDSAESAIDDVTLATCVMLHPTPNNNTSLLSTQYILKRKALVRILIF